MARLFVQFMHPGPEPWCGENESGICEWNTTEHHRRKCIRADIRCWDRTMNVETGPKEMYFWGEWEASSRYKLLQDSRIGMPRAVHEIIPPQPGSCPPGGQNTDPFVFGERFLYTICRQPSYPSLRSLDVGSIIAFGSRLRDGEKTYFGLDTLFVVGNRSVRLDSDPGRNDWSVLTNKKEYEEATIKPLSLGQKNHEIKKGSKDLPIRIYSASMADDLRDRLPLFSFVPCGPNPFPRPKLTSLAEDGNVSNNLAQGIKLTPVSSIEDSLLLWKKIVDDLESQGIELGTRVLLRDEVIPK